MPVFHVAGSKVRHLDREGKCAALVAEIIAQHPEIGEKSEKDAASAISAARGMSRVRNTESLRADTVTCNAAGCWNDFGTLKHERGFADGAKVSARVRKIGEKNIRARGADPIVVSRKHTS